MSDGEDTSSLLPFEEVLDLAKRSETAIYTIGLRDNDCREQRLQALPGSRIRAAPVLAGNRRTRVLPQPARRPGWRLRQISDELSSQYTVGYTSKNPRRDGAWRRVVVRVNRPNTVGAHQAGILRADVALGRHEPMNLAPLALYAAAFVAYGWHFARRAPAAGRTATTLLVGAVLAHTFVIGMLTMEAGQVPVGGATSAISMFVWLLAVAYLYTEVTTDERAMGVFILPLLVALQTIPALKSDAEVRSSVLRGPLFGIHVSSLLLAYASFALACVIGITYVLLFKEIKAKHLGFFYARLPSLQVLDQMNQRAIVFGWIFLTVGLLAGGRSRPRRARCRGRPTCRRCRPCRSRIRRSSPRSCAGPCIRSSSSPRGASDGRPPRGLSVGARFCHRAAELRADQLLLHEES